jgi:hypothetical protein
MRWILWLPMLGGLLLSGCSRGPSYEPRRFQTAEQALGHWRGHEQEFRQLAAEWRQSGGREFHPYSDSWWWNTTHARKAWWGIGPWRVTRVTAPSLSASEEEDFWSLEQAARFAGVPGGILASLLHDAENLQVRSLDEVVTPAGRPCTRFDLKGGWMGRPNGFLYCLGTTEELRVKDVHGSWLCPAWVQEPASEYRVIDKDWAYFEIPAGAENE